MAHTVEVQFFNTFIMSSTCNNLHFEESRIKGGFNEPFISIGPKAHLVDESYAGVRRQNALIYSGIYNSRTDINRTNVYSAAEPITRAVDPSHGEIQKLHAEDTNLNILQNNKVSYALIDKDALFTAEGGQLTASGAAVIGQIVAYQGKYGTQNPESFAVKGGRKYFVDKNRAAVLRLSRDGITEISNYGMRDYFRDYLDQISNTFASDDKIVGGYDDHDDHYVVSLQGLPSSLGTYQTLSFDDSVNGWVSRYGYDPDFAFSHNKKFYTLKDGNIWEHYKKATCNQHYGSSLPAFVDIIANQEPSTVKNFLTINYEGGHYWKATNISTDIQSAYDVDNSSTSSSADISNIFKRKEEKFYSHLDFKAETGSAFGKNKAKVAGLEVSGVRGYFNKVRMQHDLSDPTELFSVSHNITKSS
jgi:hypothetical protein